MKLNIQADGFTLSQDLQGTVESHLRLILSRYDNVIEIVEVTLKELEFGAEGDLNKCCMVSINLTNSRSLVVQEIAAEMYDAIQYCAQKMNRVLSRQVTTLNRFQRKLRSIEESSTQTA